MGSTADLSLQLESRDGVLRIDVGGELDVASAPVLAQAIAGGEQDGASAIVLDLQDLRFMDCAGLTVLVRASAYADESGHRLAMVGANRTVQKLLHLTGTESLVDEGELLPVLDRFMEVHPDRGR